MTRKIKKIWKPLDNEFCEICDNPLIAHMNHDSYVRQGDRVSCTICTCEGIYMVTDDDRIVIKWDE